MIEIHKPDCDFLKTIETAKTCEPSCQGYGSVDIDYYSIKISDGYDHEHISFLFCPHCGAKLRERNSDGY